MRAPRSVPRPSPAGSDKGRVGAEAVGGCVLTPPAVLPAVRPARHQPEGVRAPGRQVHPEGLEEGHPHERHHAQVGGGQGCPGRSWGGGMLAPGASRCQPGVGASVASQRFPPLPSRRHLRRSQGGGDQGSNVHSGRAARAPAAAAFPPPRCALAAEPPAAAGRAPPQPPGPGVRVRARFFLARSACPSGQLPGSGLSGMAGLVVRVPSPAQRSAEFPAVSAWTLACLGCGQAWPCRAHARRWSSPVPGSW